MAPYVLPWSFEFYTVFLIEYPVMLMGTLPPLSWCIIDNEKLYRFKMHNVTISCAPCETVTTVKLISRFQVCNARLQTLVTWSYVGTLFKCFLRHSRRRWANLCFHFDLAWIHFIFPSIIQSPEGHRLRLNSLHPSSPKITRTEPLWRLTLSKERLITPEPIRRRSLEGAGAQGMLGYTNGGYLKPEALAQEELKVADYETVFDEAAGGLPGLCPGCRGNKYSEHQASVLLYN